MTSTFADAPTTKYLLLSLLTVSLASLSTPAASPSTNPSLSTPTTLARHLLSPLLAQSPGDLLFACIALYHLRVVERLWGSGKFRRYLLTTIPYTTFLPPFLLALPRLARQSDSPQTPTPLAGPTPLILALFAQYHALVPYSWRYSKGSSGNDDTSAEGMIVTSKSMTYLVPLQLAMGRLPGSLVGAGIGWFVGWSWRVGLLPGVGGAV